MIDGGSVDIGEGQTSKAVDGVVGGDRSVAHVVEECAQHWFVHPLIVACPATGDVLERGDP